jgi:hypothetical protein
MDGKAAISRKAVAETFLLTLQMCFILHRLAIEDHFIQLGGSSVIRQIR